MSRTPRSGQDDSLQQSGQTVEPLDPNERLQQLQAELNLHNSRIDHLSKQRDLLETDINGLSTTVQQVKTTVTHYGAGLKDLHNRLQALEYFYHQKSKMVLAAIGERKPLIDDLVREYDEELVRMQDHLRELEGRQSAAQEESNQAAARQDARQSEYDNANTYQQSVTGKLAEMESLRANITQADEVNDVATMYFLVLEFHNRMRDTRILSQHDLSMDLRQKLGELEAAKEQARSRSAALSTVQAEYTAFETALNNKRTERHSKLLSDVEAIYPLPMEASAPGETDITAADPAATPATPATPIADASTAAVLVVAATPAATQKK